MVNYEYADLYYRGSIDKQITIKFDDKSIINTDLYYETLNIEESICSEPELRFGGCIASSLSFQMNNKGISMKNKKMEVSEVIGGNTDAPLTIGKYKVQSDKCSMDRSYREITAYDSMYDIINADMSEWYNGLIFPMTIKQLRDLFFEELGIEQEEIILPNDLAVVYGTEYETSVSGNGIITDICAINGCFGKINRKGTFSYLFLITDSLLAYDLPKSNQINVQYEDYITKKIDRLQIVQSNLDATYNYGTGNNCYVLQTNLLSLGRTNEELETIAKNLYDIISEISYRPVTIEASGNPCIETGDFVRLYAKDGTEILTYILNRTLKGIKAPRDNYVADGVEEYDKNLNSTGNYISNINGKITSVSNNTTYVYTFKNSLELNFTDEEKTLIEINTTSINETSVVFIATIPMAMSLDGYVEFNYYINGSILTNDVVRVYLPRGESVVTLSNFFNVDSDERLEIKVTAKTEYFESDTRIHDAKILSFDNYIATGTYKEVDINTDIPSASINKNAIKAVMFARSLVPNDKEWDGNLELTDKFGQINIANITMEPFNGIAYVSFDEPIPSGITELMSTIKLGSITFNMFADNVGLNQAIENYIIDTSKANEYLFDANYVLADTSYQLNTAYSYDSTEYVMSDGKAVELAIDLTPFASVTSMDISVTPTLNYKYIIYDGLSQVYYNVANEKLNALDITELSSDAFINYGNDDIPSSDLLIPLDKFRLYAWTSETELPKLSANIISTPKIQTITTNEIDLSDSTITGIETVTVDYTGNPLFALSFDSGVTWKIHNGTEWVTISEEDTGMQAETMEAITVEQWQEVIADIQSFIMRFTLSDTTDTVTSVTIDFTN